MRAHQCNMPALHTVSHLRTTNTTCTQEVHRMVNTCKVVLHMVNIKADLPQVDLHLLINSWEEQHQCTVKAWEGEHQCTVKHQCIVKVWEWEHQCTVNKARKECRVPPCTDQQNLSLQGP